MDILTNYVVGILLIVTGLIVAKCPGMLNVMTKEQKKHTDMNAVGRMGCKWLLGMGLCQVVGTFFMEKFGLGGYMGLFNVLLVMGGSIVIAAKAQSPKYRK